MEFVYVLLGSLALIVGSSLIIYHILKRGFSSVLRKRIPTFIKSCRRNAEIKSERRKNEYLKKRIPKFIEACRKNATLRAERFLTSEMERLQSEIDALEAEAARGFEDMVERTEQELDAKRTEMIERNRLYFKCTCDEHHYIPCDIDFTLERNTFTCPRCNNVWYVDIHATPILRGYNIGVENQDVDKLLTRKPFEERGEQ